jgi:carbamoyl-phosphate synthase large subunit
MADVSGAEHPSGLSAAGGDAAGGVGDSAAGGGTAGRAGGKAVLLTGVGKRYDIVSCFARLTTTIAADPNPLAPAQYAAHHRVAPPRIDDPGYVPFLAELCARHDVGAVIPLTDLDIEVLAQARADGLLPAFVPDPGIARATYDKYETHLLLERLGLPSPPTVLPGEDPPSYPVMVKPRRGSGARSIHLARDAEETAFFVRYVEEPTMVQRAMDGPELSIDTLSDLDGRCLNAIPRTMLESRGGESIKGGAIADEELIDLGRRVVEALGVRGPCTVQVFRDREIGLGITDVNTRFGGAFPAPAYAAHEGRSYPELIVRMANGERIEPHLGEFLAGRTFTRYYWQLELDEALAPTGREIVPGGPPAPLAVPRETTTRVSSATSGR